jgi:predicted dehydrogenase
VYRGGLIGCGFVSRLHVAAWGRQTLGRLAAVCDVDAERAAAVGRSAGVPAYHDAAEMFRRERLDVVEVCTGPGSHLPLTRLAAEHGVHVLCQKPAAPTLADLDAMIAACDAAGIRLMIHENYRWRPWNVRLRDEVLAGRVGTPARLVIHVHDQRCVRPGGLADQPYFAAMPRLILYEVGPHVIDFARWLLGEPARVFAVTRRVGPQAGEDMAAVTLEFPGGAVTQLDLSWATAARAGRPEWGLFETWVDGDRGTLRTRPDGQLQWSPADGPCEVLPVAVGDDPLTGCYTATQAHFLERLRSGEPFATDGRDTRRTMRGVFAAYESAERGQPVDLSCAHSPASGS